MWNIIFLHLFKTMYTERMYEAVKKIQIAVSGTDFADS